MSTEPPQRGLNLGAIQPRLGQSTLRHWDKHIAVLTAECDAARVRVTELEAANADLETQASRRILRLQADAVRMQAELAEARAMPGLAEDCACKIDSSDCPGHHQCQPPSCCQCTWCCADMSHCQNTSSAPTSTTREA